MNYSADKIDRMKQVLSVEKGMVLVILWSKIVNPLKCQLELHGSVDRRRRHDDTLLSQL